MINDPRKNNLFSLLTYDSEDDEIIIKIKQLSDKILEVERLLNNDQIETVFGIKDNKIFPIKTQLIERIYSESRKTIIYSKGETYETRKTLVELELILGTSFVRISKSVIVNTKFNLLLELIRDFYH